MSKSISLLIQIKCINSFQSKCQKPKKKQKKKERREKSCAGYVTCTVTHSSQKNCRDMHISTYTHKFISV